MTGTGDLAGRLTSEVTRRGMTQAAAAADLGVSQQTLSRWMSGSVQPGDDRLPLLAAFLGLSIDELAGLRAVRGQGSRNGVARRVAELEARNAELEARLTRLAERLEILAVRLDRLADG